MEFVLYRGYIGILYYIGRIEGFCVLVVRAFRIMGLTSRANFWS